MAAADPAEEFVWVEEPRFVALPPEVLMNILARLSIQDLGQVALVCRAWWAVSQEPSLWRTLFLEAKRTGKVEKAPKESVSAPDDDYADAISSLETLDWRERYKSTYYFKKGFLFLGDRRKNQITIRLDTSRFIADEPSLALSGELTLVVASSSLTTHGIYIAFNAHERRFAPDEESEQVNKMWAIHHPVTDEVAWEARNSRKQVFPQGTHRFRFRVPFPRTNVPPSTTRVVKSIQYAIAYEVRGMIAYPWPFPDSWTSVTGYRLTVLPNPRTRLSLMRAARETPYVKTFSRLGPGLEFTVSLPRMGFFVGERVRLAVSVRNGMPWDYEQVTLRAVELMRWNNHQQQTATGSGPWNTVEPSRLELEQRRRHPLLVAHDHQRVLERLRLDGVDVDIADDNDNDNDNGEVIWPEEDGGGGGGRKLVFRVDVRKHSTHRFVLAFVLDEQLMLNPPPWCLPCATDIEHRYALKVALRKAGLWAASTTEEALVEPVVIDSPQLLLAS